MRVISGEKRHISLITLEKMDIRPTTDKIKETLFNIIQFKLDNVNFLDIFAGSGAIGIEALSRGARFATFIDNNREAIKIIEENLKRTNLTEKAEIIHMDASLSIELLSRKKVVYDIVFLDPPYDLDLYMDVLKKLHLSHLINNDTIIILETSKKDDVNKIVALGYEITREKIYKNNKHVFLKKV